MSGARAIRVQDIPNGAVGRPVEFESMFNLVIFILTIVFVFTPLKLNSEFSFQLMDHMLDLEIWKFW